MVRPGFWTHDLPLGRPALSQLSKPGGGSQERLCTWPHFEGEGFWNSEVAYWLSSLDIYLLQDSTVFAQVLTKFLTSPMLEKTFLPYKN